jgi:hypothetical protein
MRTKCWSESLKGREDSEDIRVDGRITLRCILGSRMRSCGMNSSGSGRGKVVRSRELGNEFRVS